MKAVLRRLHSPDVQDLAAYQPTDREAFGFLIQAMIGPEGIDGEESFDIVVCSPKWLLQTNERDAVIVGRHHLIMLEYDYGRLVRTVEAFCRECEADSWEGLALKLGRLGKWEFEDYSAPSGQ